MEEAEAIRRVAGALLTGGGAIGVGIGVGLITAKYLEGIARQPELQPYLFTQLLMVWVLWMRSPSYLWQ